jgi:hypothetical protein
MMSMHQEEREAFPAAGSRARALKRFERDLHAWLSTPDGQFAAWDARRAVSAGAVRAQAADDHLRVVGREAR